MVTQLESSTPEPGSVDWLEALFERSRMGKVLADGERRIVRVNRAYAQLLGYAPEDLVGRSLDEITHPDDLATELSQFSGLVGGSLLTAQQRKRYLTRDGRVVWVDRTASLVELGGQLFGLGEVVDVTAQVEAEAALARQAGENARLLRDVRSSEDRFRAIWASASDAMAFSDADGIVLDANPAYCELYGYRPEQVIGQSFAIIFPPDQRAWAIEQYREIMHARSLLPAYESVIQHASGEMRVVESHATFVAVGDGQTGMLSIIRDVTDRRRAEDARARLLEQERLAREAAEEAADCAAQLYQEAQQARAAAEEAVRIRDAFLSVAAHELRNPLSSLLGNAQLLQRRGMRVGTYHERDMRALSVIAAQATRMNQLITTLLDFSRLEAGQLRIEPAPLDLVMLVQGVLDELQPAMERHALDWQRPTQAVMIDGDELRLIQVLQNLLGNAIKYSLPGTTIKIRLTEHEGQACVAIADEGMGIPADAIPKLFRRFYRADNIAGQHISGIGVGLYVVSEIVTLHGGRVDVDSQEGRGSTFTVRLPLVRQAS